MRARRRSIASSCSCSVPARCSAAPRSSAIRASSPSSDCCGACSCSWRRRCSRTSISPRSCQSAARPERPRSPAARLRPDRRAAARDVAPRALFGPRPGCAASPFSWRRSDGSDQLAACLAQLRQEGVDPSLRLGERALDRRRLGPGRSGFPVRSRLGGRARERPAGREIELQLAARNFWRTQPERLQLIRDPSLGLPQAASQTAAVGHHRADRDPADLGDLDLQRIDDSERPAGLAERPASDAHPLERRRIEIEGDLARRRLRSAARASSRCRVACARRCRPR